MPLVHWERYWGGQNLYLGFIAEKIKKSFGQDNLKKQFPIVLAAFVFTRTIKECINTYYCYCWVGRLFGHEGDEHPNPHIQYTTLFFITDILHPPTLMDRSPHTHLKTRYYRPCNSNINNLLLRLKYMFRLVLFIRTEDWRLWSPNF